MAGGHASQSTKCNDKEFKIRLALRASLSDVNTAFLAYHHPHPGIRPKPGGLSVRSREPSTKPKAGPLHDLREGVILVFGESSGVKGIQRNQEDERGIASKASSLTQPLDLDQPLAVLGGVAVAINAQ